jgi:hypothetical protein
LCGVDVKIGTGGEYNWDQHLASMDHVNNSKAKPSKKLISFFSKLPKATLRRSPEASMSLVAAPPLLSSTLPLILSLRSHTTSPEREPGPSNANVKSAHDDGSDSADVVAPIDVDTYDDTMIQFGDSMGVSLGAQLLAQLRAAASNLSDSIALAKPSDDIARFSRDPEDESHSYEDPWEMVDNALNLLVGYGKSTTEVVGLIQRGQSGIDRLCNWLEICLDKLNIDAVLLEGKVTCIIDAMKLLYVFFSAFCSLFVHAKHQESIQRRISYQCISNHLHSIPGSFTFTL